MGETNGKKIFISTVLSEFVALLETVFISLFIMAMVFTYLLKVATVKGESMKNTLMPEERLIASAWCISPQSGDIIIIDARNSILLGDDNSVEISSGLNKQIVKRIIATEGQTVNIDFERGAVYVDDVMLDESYITGLTHLDEGAFTDKYPIEVPEGCVFVMGDNRSVSKDSRSVEVGFISEEEIIGKVLFRISPIEEFGTVK